MGSVGIFAIQILGLGFKKRGTLTETDLKVKFMLGLVLED